jgi:hypothetical protein
MRHILAAKNVVVLKRFTSGNVLLAFDFDGTLSLIEFCTTASERVYDRASTRHESRFSTPDKRVVIQQTGLVDHKQMESG